MDEPAEGIPYKYSRSGGPTLAPVVWLMTSLGNYRWACRMGLYLAGEYTQRFGGKTHKTQAVLEWLRDNEPRGLPDVGFTTPLCAMPDEYKVEGDPLASYRKYYVYDKHRFAVWPEGMEPGWFTEGVADLKRRGLYNKVEIAYPTKNQKQAILEGRKGKRRQAARRVKPEALAVKRERSKRGVAKATVAMSSHLSSVSLIFTAAAAEAWLRPPGLRGSS